MRTAVVLLLCTFSAVGVSASKSRTAGATHGRAAATAVAAAAGWYGKKRQHHHHHEPQAVVQRTCSPGCELNGNCNKALGVCECAIGYVGLNCSQPLWGACRVAPQQQELYCSNDWQPKSCACLQQCAAFVCPDGTHASCERDFDLFNSKCFLRPPGNQSLEGRGGGWDGGSDLPEDIEQGVKYYKGWLHKDITQEITREDVTDVGIIEDVDPLNPLVALPLSSCPLKCSLQGGCVRRKDEVLPFCTCHYGFTGEFCEQRAEQTELQGLCWNNCQGRGTCRRGFCHCQPGWWGKDCSSSRVFAPHSARRLVHKLRVYVYDLPWTVSYQPEYQLGWKDHDQNYMAWLQFGQMLLNDTTVRTENPWEANLFYIPAMTYAFSENTGNSVLHSRRAIDYVRQHWPFFNRSQGLDHLIWLTGDRGACDWPAEEDPSLANLIKVVHFGWHHAGSKLGEPKGWEGLIKNKHWGCFHPLRDIVAAAYWHGQAEMAQETFARQHFDVQQIPQGRLVFFSGGIRLNSPEYSQGVRQQLWRMYGDGSNPQVLIHPGGMAPDEYTHMLRTSRYCIAPSGYGWGIRLNHYMVRGCVPVIIQDDIYQPWEEQLPYSDFSVRLPKSSIPDMVQLLSEISDQEYLELRAGVAKYWKAFVWDKSIGGTAYDLMIKSLKERMLRLQARHYHPLQLRSHPHPHRPATNASTSHSASINAPGTTLSMPPAL